MKMARQCDNASLDRHEVRHVWIHFEVDGVTKLFCTFAVIRRIMSFWVFALERHTARPFRAPGPPDPHRTHLRVLPPVQERVSCGLSPRPRYDRKALLPQGLLWLGGEEDSR